MDLDFTAGRWAAIDCGWSIVIGVLGSQTDKTVQFKEADYRTVRKGKLDIKATFSTEEEARAFGQKWAGIRGEKHRREMAALTWASGEYKKLIEAARTPAEPLTSSTTIEE